MTIIRVAYVDQIGKYLETPDIYSGDVGTDFVEFQFNELWDGYDKTAVFYVDAEHPYKRDLGADGIVEIPYEVLLNPGYFNFGVFGIKDNKRITTAVMSYRVGTGTPVEGYEPSVPELQPEVVDETAREGIRLLSEKVIELADALEEIPEPYALPTASADVKGGVKVGEGLQMDGDVLGVVPEPEYELLETIVCDGTYGNLSRTDPALTHAKIYIHTQAAEAAFSIGVEAKNTAGMFGYAWIGNGINTGERWAYVYFVSDGKDAYCEHYGPVSSICGTANVARTVNIRDASTPINRINIYATGGAMFPAGSTIEIWGVRANA